MDPAVDEDGDIAVDIKEVKLLECYEKKKRFAVPVNALF